MFLFNRVMHTIIHSSSNISFLCEEWFKYADEIYGMKALLPCKIGGKNLGNLTTRSVAQLSYVHHHVYSQQLRGQSCILPATKNKQHQRAAQSVWNTLSIEAKDSKGIPVTSVKISSSDAISCGGRYLELHNLHDSLPPAVKLQTQMCFTDRTYTTSLELIWISIYSFFVSVDRNVDKLLHLESVTSVVPWITW